MADIYIGYNRGDNLAPDNAQEGTATNNTDVELRFNDSVGLTRQDITLIMEAIARYLDDGRTAVYTQ